MYGRSFGQILRFVTNLRVHYHLPVCLQLGCSLACLGLPLDEFSVAFLFLPTRERVLLAVFVRPSSASSSEVELLCVLNCASNVVSASGQSELPSPSLASLWEDLPI